MVWACAAKRRQWLGEEMYGVWNGGCQAKSLRGRPKKTWREIVETDFQTRKLNIKDAIDRNRWRKQIRDDWWPPQNGWMFLLVLAHPGCPGQNPKSRSCSFGFFGIAVKLSEHDYLQLFWYPRVLNFRLSRNSTQQADTNIVPFLFSSFLGELSKFGPNR